MSFTNAQLAQQMADMIAHWSDFAKEYSDWLGGAVDGGPGSDGAYPLTDWYGTEYLVNSPAKLQDTVDNLVSGAQGYSNSAAASASAASTSETNAASSASAASTDAAAAAASAAAAAVDAGDADSSATVSTTQANLATDRAGYAQEWANKAEDSLVSVAAGGDNVDDYSALHHANKASASAAAALVSETNAAASAAAAATFDPALFGELAGNDTITGTWRFNTAPLLGNAVFLQGRNLADNASYDLIGINAADWIEFGDTSRNVQYDGALHKFSSVIEAFANVDIKSGNNLILGAATVTEAKVGNWDTAYGWGNHASAGYQLAATAIETEDDATLNTLVLTPDTTTDSWGLRLESSNNPANDSGFWATSNNWRLLLRDSAGNIDIDLNPGGTSYLSPTVIQGQTTSQGLVQVETGTFLRYYNSGWTYQTHDVLRNSYYTNLGDYVTLKASGNSAGSHGIIAVADNGFYVGLTDAETGTLVPNNDATDPLTETWLRVKENELLLRGESPTGDVRLIIEADASNTGPESDQAELWLAQDGRGVLGYFRTVDNNNLEIGSSATTVGTYTTPVMQWAYNSNAVTMPGSLTVTGNIAAGNIPAYNSFTGGAIVTRHSSGYIYSNYFNQSIGSATTGTPTHVPVCTGSDGFFRWQTLGNFVDKLQSQVWDFQTMPQMRYGIGGDYSSVSGNSTFGATIWSLDDNWKGGISGNNSANTSVYGIRWLRGSHTNAEATTGEGLYTFQNAVQGMSIGINGGTVPASGDITKKSHGNYLYHQSSSYDNDQNGGITFSTSAASGGTTGDIWFQYS